jgi:hypothetical protein
VFSAPIVRTELIRPQSNSISANPLPGMLPLSLIEFLAKFLCNEMRAIQRFSQSRPTL